MSVIDARDRFALKSAADAIQVEYLFTTEQIMTAVLVLFLYMNDAELTPYEVQQLAGLMHAPITSVRRAMTDLTKAGKLIKTTNMKPGPYGNPSHTWRLA